MISSGTVIDLKDKCLLINLKRRSLLGLSILHKVNCFSLDTTSGKYTSSFNLSIEFSEVNIVNGILFVTKYCKKWKKYSSCPGKVFKSKYVSLLKFNSLGTVFIKSILLLIENLFAIVVFPDFFDP